MVFARHFSDIRSVIRGPRDPRISSDNCLNYQSQLPLMDDDEDGAVADGGAGADELNTNDASPGREGGSSIRPARRRRLPAWTEDFHLY